MVLWDAALYRDGAMQNFLHLYASNKWDFDNDEVEGLHLTCKTELQGELPILCDSVKKPTARHEGCTRDLDQARRPL